MQVLAFMPERMSVRLQVRSCRSDFSEENFWRESRSDTGLLLSFVKHGVYEIFVKIL